MSSHAREAALLPNYNRKLDYYSPASPPGLYRLLEEVGAPTTGSMLDVGCGDGRAAQYAIQHDMTYVGIDYSPDRVNKARGHYRTVPAAHPPVFACGDLYTTLPHFATGISLIFCCELLEHLEEPAKIWAEMKRIVAADGMVVCSCPVNMPHENHLQVFENEDELHKMFPGITTCQIMQFDTPGKRKRDHFTFTFSL